MLKIKGVDISYCQQNIDYSALKSAGVKFAIIRAGIGTRTDSLLDTHVRGCTANGIAYGFYWYSVASSVQAAKAEAAACLKAISRYDRPAYPVFYDMEEKSQIERLDRKTRTDMALAFCAEIERGGYPAGVYANPAWLESYYEKSRLVGKYDIWLAHWTNDPSYPSKYDYGQTMWQWGLDNIGMDVDGDISFIDYPAKTAYWYSTHPAPTSDTSKTSAASQTAPASGTPAASAPASETPAASAPAAPAQSRDLRKGDGIILKNAPLYISSTARNKSTTVTGTYYIYCDGVINNRVRITRPLGCADCTGWVRVSDCKTVAQDAPAAPEAPVSQDVPASQPTPSVKVGDTVKVKAGAKTYGGAPLAVFVYTGQYEVMQVGTTGRPDYVVIGQGGEITAAVRECDLIA